MSAPGHSRSSADSGSVSSISPLSPAAPAIALAVPDPPTCTFRNSPPEASASAALMDSFRANGAEASEAAAEGPPSAARSSQKTHSPLGLARVLPLLSAHDAAVGAPLPSRTGAVPRHESFIITAPAGAVSPSGPGVAQSSACAAPTASQTRADAFRPAEAPTLRRHERSTVGARGRAGVPNYSADDVGALLDIVEAHEPLGSNEWAGVAAEFRQWAAAHGRMCRDVDSLKKKFDKLANMKKKTGDPSCPPEVRRAKHIARSILSRAAALPVDGESSSSESAEDGGTGDSIGSGAKGNMQEHEDGDPRGGERSSRVTRDGSVRGSALGSRTRKRPEGAGGVRSGRVEKKTDAVLVTCIESMAEKMGDISRALLMPSAPSVDITSTVQKEVASAMAPTLAALQEMKDLISSLIPKDA